MEHTAVSRPSSCLWTRTTSVCLLRLQRWAVCWRYPCTCGHTPFFDCRGPLVAEWWTKWPMRTCASFTLHERPNPQPLNLIPCHIALSPDAWSVSASPLYHSALSLCFCWTKSSVACNFFNIKVPLLVSSSGLDFCLLLGLEVNAPMYISTYARTYSHVQRVTVPVSRVAVSRALPN